MAYAGIVGVPPIMGLYTIVPPLIAYALLGTSRLLVVGPDTATGLISALTVGAIATQGTAEFNALTSTLAFLTPRASRRFRPGSQDLDRCSRPSRSGDHRSHDSSLEGAGFEPSVPLLRPVAGWLKKAPGFVRKVSRDACAPVKCAGGVAILTIEWLDGDRYLRWTPIVRQPEPLVKV